MKFQVFTEGGTGRAERHTKTRKQMTLLCDGTGVYLQSGQKSTKSSGPELRRAGERWTAFRAFSCSDPSKALQLML